MLTIHKIIHNFTYKDRLRPLFFDIETTGFDRNRTILYMIGCIYPEGDCGHFVQWFNDDGLSEPEILQAFSELMKKDAWTLVTFNGESFDIPYLKHHSLLNELDLPIEKMPSLDLYRIMRPFQQLYQLQHGGQKYWERFLGIYRDDPYNGGELIEVYRSYLQKKEDRDLHDLLLHNEEDILGMIQLMDLLPYHSLVTGNYSLKDIEITDLAQSSLFQFSSYMDPTEQEETEDFFPEIFPHDPDRMISCVHFQGTLDSPLPRPLVVGGKQGLFTGEAQDIHLYLPIYTGELKHFYKKYRNYYYLPEEDRAIHKSVGQFVDKAHRQQAVAANCYMRESGLYLSLPEARKHFGFQIDSGASYETLPRFRKDYTSEEEYIQCEKLLFRTDELLHDYIRDMTLHIFMVFLEAKKNGQSPLEETNSSLDETSPKDNSSQDDGSLDDGTLKDF